MTLPRMRGKEGRDRATSPILSRVMRLAVSCHAVPCCGLRSGAVGGGLGTVGAVGGGPGAGRARWGAVGGMAGMALTLMLLLHQLVGARAFPKAP
jgi:hypothetical protein